MVSVSDQWRKCFLDFLLQQKMVVARGAARIDAGVEVGRGFQILVSEQLLHQLEGTRGVVQQDLRREVAEFVGRQLDAGVFAEDSRLISHASVCDVFSVPSGLTKIRVGFLPRILDAI